MSRDIGIDGSRAGYCGLWLYLRVWVVRLYLSEVTVEAGVRVAVSCQLSAPRAPGND